MPGRSLNDDKTGDDQVEHVAASLETKSAAIMPSDAPLPRRIRIFVVDDHPMVRKGLHMLLNLQPDLQVCGDAAGVSTAKSGILELRPDLVVVDLGLQDGDGFELLEWLRQHHPYMKRLVFTLHDDLAYSERAFKYGAQGYVVKYDGTQELIRAIRLVVHNEPYVRSTTVHPERRVAPNGGRR